MQTACRAIATLFRRPVLLVPQLLAALINLLVYTFADLLAVRLSHSVRFGTGALLSSTPTLQTPDLLLASQTVQIPVVMSSHFVQYAFTIAAIPVVAELLRCPGLPLAEAARRAFSRRGWAILNCALLLIGILLFDQMCQYAVAAGFAYIPALRPEPAWMLIALFWLTDILSYTLFFAVAVPWMLALALPYPAQIPDELSRHNARLWVFAAWIAWSVGNYLWSRVEAHTLVPRVDPGPFWHAPITLGSPAWSFVVLSVLSVMAALVARPSPLPTPQA